MPNQFYNLQASFTQVTELSAASPLYPSATDHQFILDWSYPAQDRPTLLQYDIESVRIYRYIGDHNECIDPRDIPEPPTSGIPGTGNASKLRLVYQANQNGADVDEKTYTYDSNGLRTLESTDITASVSVTSVTQFTDDLNSYYSSALSPHLSRAHNSAVEETNKTLLNEIYSTERPLVYVIATYTSETQDALGMSLNAQGGSEDRLTSYSTKTQVRHDTLHYEFDMMWTSRMNRGGSTGITTQGISRTAIDADALHRDDGQLDIHRGPNGRGGWAWVSDRGPNGYVFRLNLSNGIAAGKSTNTYQNQRIDATTGNTSTPAAPGEQPDDYQRYYGHGITLDRETGFCWTGSGAGHVVIISNAAPTGSTDQTLSNTLKSELDDDHGTRYDNWSFAQNNWVHTDTHDYGKTYGTAYCGTERVNIVLLGETGLKYERDPATEEISSASIEYQLGVFGAVNSRKSVNWLTFCVKSGTSKTASDFKTGNNEDTTEYLRKQILIRKTEDPCTHEWNDLGSVVTKWNPNTTNFDEWEGFYDYFHPGGVQWIAPVYTSDPLSGYYFHNPLLSANDKFSEENLDTGDAVVTLSGLGTPTTYASGDWNSWYDYRSQAATAIHLPYCINNTPNDQFIYIDSNQTEVRITTATNGDFVVVQGGDISDPGTSIVTDHSHLFPNLTASVTPPAGWLSAANPYVAEEKFSAVYFTTAGDIMQRAIDTDTWASSEVSMVTPATFSSMALDVDDTNNIIGFGNKRIKIYRMDSDFTDNADSFPYGPSARYPNVPLDDQPYSVVNTKEIEWFLTRDHYEMDDITAKTSAGGNFVSQTALDAWMSLVEFNRFEAAHDADGLATTVSDLTSRGWDPADTLGYGDTTYTVRFGVRMDSSVYDPDDSALDDPASIVALIREWSDTYASPVYGAIYEDNREGRYLHPNHRDNHSNNEWRAHPSFEQVSTGTVEKDGGAAADYWYRLQKDMEFSGSSDSYNQMVANTVLSAGEYLYNYDLIHPEVVTPTLTIVVTGSNVQSYAESTPDCYPWLQFTLSAGPAVSSYDNADINFSLNADPGTFIVRNWYFYHSDHPHLIPTSYSDPALYSLLTKNNQGTLTQDLSTYLTSVEVDYTYIDPSVGGRIYLSDPAVGSNPYSADHAILPRKTPIPLYGDGSFTPHAFITARDVYEDMYENYNNWTWTSNKTTSADYQDDCILYAPSAYSSLSADVDVSIYERWPEPQFFQAISENSDIRQDYFGTATYAPRFVDDPRYDKSADFIHMSNAGDAVRRDLFIGVEPLSAVIQDRSISRSFPVTSRYMQVSTDMQWISSADTIPYYFSSNETTIDIQSNFAYLTSHTYNFGTNLISLTAEALSAATISDKVFSQCVAVQEMEPFAGFVTLSGHTVPSTYTATSAATSVLVSTASGNAQFDSGDYYISGYAPYMKVYFQDVSFAHTMPISSYNWDFGDAYNEGPADIYDTESNFYTLTTSQLTAGGFHWDGVTIPWGTDSSGGYASHTYIMPGDYTVTLTARASNTGTSDEYAEYPELVDGEFQYSVHVEEIDPVCGVTLAGLTSSTMSTDVSTVSGTSPITAYFSMSGYTPGSFLPCEIIWKIDSITTETISRIPATVTTSQGLSVIYDTTYPNDVTRAILPVVIDTSNSGAGTLTVEVSTVICNTNSIYYCGSSETGEFTPETIKTQDYSLFRSKIDDDGNLFLVFTDDTDGTSHTITLSGELADA